MYIKHLSYIISLPTIIVVYVCVSLLFHCVRESWFNWGEFSDNVPVDPVVVSIVVGDAIMILMQERHTAITYYKQNK